VSGTERLYPRGLRAGTSGRIDRLRGGPVQCVPGRRARFARTTVPQ